MATAIQNVMVWLYRAGAVGVGAALLGGCGARVITPPAGVGDPVTIRVADYGDTTRILWPWYEPADADEPTAWVEYGYGEWGWYANDRMGPARGFAALFLPTDGTLGRRVYRGGPVIPEPWYGDGWYDIAVERADVAVVLAELDARYQAAIETEIFNDGRGMTFVRDDTRYHLWHHSGTEASAWLREAGCEVRGLGLVAAWRVKEPREER